LNLNTEVTDTTIQVGQEIVVRATNKTANTITNGQVVYVDGAQGHRPTIALASSSSHDLSHGTLGFATHDIAPNNTGYVTTFGLVRGLNTSALSAGDTIFLSLTSGSFVNERQPSPNHSVKLGTCLYSHSTEGIILVQITVGYDITELHDVCSTAATANNDVLI